MARFSGNIFLPAWSSGWGPGSRSIVIDLVVRGPGGRRVVPLVRAPFRYRPRPYLSHVYGLAGLRVVDVAVIRP